MIYVFQQERNPWDLLTLLFTPRLDLVSMTLHLAPIQGVTLGVSCTILMGSPQVPDFSSLLGFSAGSGWDPVTGLGTPDFAKLSKLV